MPNNLQDILLEIKNHLTNNQEDNIKYLYSLKGKYNDHPQAKEIYKQIGLLMVENANQDVVVELNHTFHQDFDQQMIAALKVLETGDLIKTENMLLDTLEFFQKLFPDYSSQSYYAPNNPIEYQIIHDMLKEDYFKTIQFNFSDAYLYLGSINIDKQDIEKARRYMQEGLNLNPCNQELIFEYIETYRIENDLETFKDLTMKAFDKLYSPQGISRYFRNLGFYYIEAKKFDLAKDLFIHSMMFERNNAAINELIYIEQTTHDANLPKGHDIVNAIDNEFIPLNVSKHIWNIIKDIRLELQNVNIDHGFVDFVQQLDEFYDRVNQLTQVHIHRSKLS